MRAQPPDQRRKVTSRRGLKLSAAFNHAGRRCQQHTLSVKECVQCQKQPTIVLPASVPVQISTANISKPTAMQTQCGLSPPAMVSMQLVHYRTRLAIVRRQLLAVNKSHFYSVVLQHVTISGVLQYWIRYELVQADDRVGAVSMQ